MCILFRVKNISSVIKSDYNSSARERRNDID